MQVIREYSCLSTYPHIDLSAYLPKFSWIISVQVNASNNIYVSAIIDTTQEMQQFLLKSYPLEKAMDMHYGNLRYIGNIQVHTQTRHVFEIINSDKPNQ